MPAPSLYLGLDSSTQSLSAIVIEVNGERRRVIFESSLAFDDELPQYGTDHGVLRRADPAVAVSSPVMWVEALDLMLRRIAQSGLNLDALAAIAGSAQQHGSVYLNAGAARTLASLDPDKPLTRQVESMLSRPDAPIWMDSSTSAECAEITAAVGGEQALAERTGSRAFERFTGPQIRKFFKTSPDAYEATHRVHLVSSFLASMLAGQYAPLDPGDGSGMNLMDLATAQWWPAAADATAPGLLDRLPALAPSSTVVGRLAPYWQRRHRLPAAKIVAWSGDNPCSLIGSGLIREGRVAISLGTSDTIFGPMKTPRTSADGTGHVFGAPTGEYMGITVFKNGSLARERVRDAWGLTWAQFSEALRSTPPGNDGRLLLPWFEPEITPFVPEPRVRRYHLDENDGPGHVRAVVEAQQMALARHSRWMNVDVDTIHATGGAAANRDILQVMADVFGADVYQLEVGNSACLGAALRAYHADVLSEGRPIAWDEVVADLAEPVAASRVQPNRRHHETYRQLMERHAEVEGDSLRGVRSQADRP